MIDYKLLPISHMALKPLVYMAVKCKISSNTITITGFFIGVLAMVLIYLQLYPWALSALIINRIFDGLDGEVARATNTTSDAGGFLDISLDFLFYSGMVVAFALTDSQNMLPALLLIFSFIGTGSSFLAFASVSAKHGKLSPVYPNKSLYYLSGLTEGGETILFFVLCCLFSTYFGIMAFIFAGMCAITTVMRIVFGYKMLKKY